MAVNGGDTGFFTASPDKHAQTRLTAEIAGKTLKTANFMPKQKPAYVDE
ncbi:MAG TPA: hypothetical protein VHB73_03395 [Alphaproteobacteria bacterium]|nr:hypothetical protein [Alphaproteobacteria bacterium]